MPSARGVISFFSGGTLSKGGPLFPKNFLRKGGKRPKIIARKLLVTEDKDEVQNQRDEPPVGFSFQRTPHAPSAERSGKQQKQE
jgi:hypothetical protein